MSTLLQFTVGNYRSFRQKKTFTFVPTSIQDTPKESVIYRDGYKYSTVSAVYGANSSGKSNLVQALNMMEFIILNSVKLNDNDPLNYDPFVLSEEGDANVLNPMYFETVFLNDSGVRVRYGFENTSDRIVKEWLFVKKNKTKKEVPLFLRDEEGIAVNEDAFKEGMDREELTNDNRLFLSLVAQLGGEFSKEVMSFFVFECNIASGLEHKSYKIFSGHQFMQRSEICNEALDFFKKLQFGIENIEVEERDVDFNGNKAKQVEIYSTHNIYNNSGEVIGTHRFPFGQHESHGTQKMFDLAGPIFDTLNSGSIIVVDELDAKMHPLISQQIVKLFTSKESNPKGAQLLFTTHDTNLLSSRILRRDQIWFTEKDSTESTDLYRLTDIVLPDGSKPRGDGNIERNYIKGRYGAIPFITYNE